MKSYSTPIKDKGPIVLGVVLTRATKTPLETEVLTLLPEHLQNRQHQGKLPWPKCLKHDLEGLDLVLESHSGPWG